MNSYSNMWMFETPQPKNSFPKARYNVKKIPIAGQKLEVNRSLPMTKSVGRKFSQNFESPLRKEKIAYLSLHGCSIDTTNRTHKTLPVETKSKVELPKIKSKNPPKKRTNSVFSYVNAPLLLQNPLISKKKKFFQDKAVTQDMLSKAQGYLHTVYPPKAINNKPLLIILIEGIIADCPFSFKKTTLVIRSDMIGFLREISKKFQVVLVSGWGIGKIQKVLDCLKESKISATYKLVDRRLTQSEDSQNKDYFWCLNYSRIYKDFQIHDSRVPQSVIVLVPLTNTEDLIGKNLQCYCWRAPVPTFDFQHCPVAIGLLHIGFKVSINLEALDLILRSLAEKKNVLRNFYALSLPNVNKIKTSLLYWKLVFTLYAPRIRESTKEERSEELFSYFVIVSEDLCTVKTTAIDYQK